MRSRIDARQRWLQGEQAALAARVAEATAPAVAERDERLSAAAALRQQVEGLRYDKAFSLTLPSEWIDP